jgi:hypothetical protein
VLEVVKTDVIAIHEALAKAFKKTFTLMATNATRKRPWTLWVWDSVYMKLIVVFTDERRTDDATDVICVSFKGLDAKGQRLPEVAALDLGETEGSLIYEQLTRMYSRGPRDVFRELARAFGFEPRFGFCPDEDRERRLGLVRVRRR